MKILEVLLLSVVLFFQGTGQAEAGIGNKVIGSTVKVALKIYISMINIEKEKKKAVAKIKNMDEEKYRGKYAKLYRLIKDLPDEVKIKYNITSHMSKEQMIKNIESMDKKTAYRIMNYIPDETIAVLFKEYLEEMGRKTPQ